MRPCPVGLIWLAERACLRCSISQCAGGSADLEMVPLLSTVPDSALQRLPGRTDQLNSERRSCEGVAVVIHFSRQREWYCRPVAACCVGPGIEQRRVLRLRMHQALPFLSRIQLRGEPPQECAFVLMVIAFWWFQ